MISLRTDGNDITRRKNNTSRMKGDYEGRMTCVLCTSRLNYCVAGRDDGKVQVMNKQINQLGISINTLTSLKEYFSFITSDSH